jgi:hypothetical protein
MPENWNADGLWRSDGLTLHDGPDGWVILPGDDRRAIGACPCCGFRIRKIEHARLLADKIYPLAAEAA